MPTTDTPPTPLTADTITDEQIAELADLSRAHRENDLDTYRIAMTALEDGSARQLAQKIISNWSMPVSIAEAKILAHAALGEYREARARCAEILNARSGSPGGAA